MRSSSALDLKRKERSWIRSSISNRGYDTITAPIDRGGRCRSSLSSLQSLDDMVTSGALYRKRYSGMGETRSMTGGLDDIVYKNLKNDQEDVRSLHFSYSVSSESRPPSRNPSFRIRRANGDKDETDRRSVISDGVHILFIALKQLMNLVVSNRNTIKSAEKSTKIFYLGSHSD